MIFPKQQMQIENEGSSLLKKQAIQLIIQLYLKRKRDEDIQFLKKNFGTTSELVKSIGSCMQLGLTSEQAENNKFTYGQNEKKAPSKCFSFIECLKRQFLTLYSAIPLILAFSILIICSLNGLSEVRGSSITIILLIVFGSLLRTLTHYFWSRKLKNISVDKTKNQFYQVLRNGVHMQIKQSQIVVGDVVELGFKQRAPATGVILSPNQIFVKENRKTDSTQPKLNLEGCLKRIENMSDLDLKICFENSNLPSPIIIRGSQLLKGRIYSILVISVTDEQLLAQFNYEIDDKFSSKSIDKWITNLIINWNRCVVILGLLSLLFFVLQQLVQFKMLQKNLILQRHFVHEFGLKLSVLLLIVNPSFLLSFIESIYLKLMTQLKFFQNFESLFMLKRIIFNERSIVEEDKIDGVQIVVGSKPDIISLSELSRFSDSYLRRLKEATDTFSINMPDNLFGFDQSRKNKRLIHVNSKKMKIITIFYECQQNWQKSRGPLKPIMLRNNDSASEQNKIDTGLKGMSLLNNRNILKIPCAPQKKEKQNLKQIINLRCQIKSKAIIDGLVGLAENGLKTFYLIVFDNNCFSKITHINVEGQQRIFTVEQKEKMITLSKKMQLVYNITPIILAYSYGAYSSMSNRTLICILGIHLQHNDQMMQSLSELSQMDIKSIVIKDKIEQLENKSRIQMQKIIGEEYANRGWVKKEEICQIVECCSIRNAFGRLICRQCLIQRCDCKQKVEEVSNIQPFLQVCDKIKIIYNVDSEDVKYLESAYKQLYRHTFVVDSNKMPATDLIFSIFCCLNFAQKLRRSLLSFYCSTAVYFLQSIICWVSNQQFVSPTQIALSFAILSSFYFLGCLADVKGQFEKEQAEYKGKVRLTQKDKMIKSFFVCCLILVCCRLFQAFHYLIPDQGDRYSEHLQKQNLNITKCKFGPNNSISIQFKLYDCQTSEFGFQYSRFSTFIITYMYFSLWLLILTLHRNFKSLFSLICYACGLIAFLVFIQYAPSIIHTYSFGLTSIHYGIISLGSIITVVVGYIIGHFAGKIQIVKHFLQQIKSCISFQQQKSNYIDKLKVYYQRKKWVNDASRQESICQLKDNI